VFADCKVFYDDYWTAPNGSDGLYNTTKVEDPMAGIVPPSSFPAIGFYHPPHAQFETYDFFIIAWSSAESKTVLGYQLKEGKRVPDIKKSPKLCDQSFRIRGNSDGVVQDPKGWAIASDDQLDQFLGVSGAALCPKAARMLKDGAKRKKKADGVKFRQ
jgi:hypothetical protein